MRRNFLLMADSYKAGHAGLYPDNVTHLYGYYAHRRKYAGASTFFGLQYYLKEYLSGVVFTEDDIREAAEFWTKHFGRSDYFNESLWMNLLHKHGGKLPLRIRGIKEGTSVFASGAPVFSVENTDPEFPWLVTFVETILLKVWYPSLIYVQSQTLRTNMNTIFSSRTLASPEYYVHDFGYRACASDEQAALGAAAHLCHFGGSDTVAGVRLLQHYYHADMPGTSIPATEHSIVLGHNMNDESAFDRVLETLPEGFVSFVIDTADPTRFLRTVKKKYKNAVLKRDGTIVFRPDSGNYADSILNTIQLLDDAFGSERNEFGLNVLNDHVRVIWGSGVDIPHVSSIYGYLSDYAYSPENLVLGMGGGLLHNGTYRGALDSVFKISDVTTSDGQHHNVRKTASGKVSLVGRVEYSNDQHSIVYEGDPSSSFTTIFEDGVLVQELSFDDISRRSTPTEEVVLDDDIPVNPNERPVAWGQVEFDNEADVPERRRRAYGRNRNIARAVENAVNNVEPLDPMDLLQAFHGADRGLYRNPRIAQPEEDRVHGFIINTGEPVRHGPIDPFDALNDPFADDFLDTEEPF